MGERNRDKLTFREKALEKGAQRGSKRVNKLLLTIALWMIDQLQEKMACTLHLVLFFYRADPEAFETTGEVSDTPVIDQAYLDRLQQNGGRLSDEITFYFDLVVKDSKEAFIASNPEMDEESMVKLTSSLDGFLAKFRELVKEYDQDNLILKDDLLLWYRLVIQTVVVSKRRRSFRVTTEGLSIEDWKKLLRHELDKSKLATERLREKQL